MSYSYEYKAIVLAWERVDNLCLTVVEEHCLNEANVTVGRIACQKIRPALYDAPQDCTEAKCTSRNHGGKKGLGIKFFLNCEDIITIINWV